MVNATLEFYEEEKRQEIEGQTALLVAPSKCYFPSCTSYTSLYVQVIVNLWEYVGYMKVKDFPPNLNPKVKS